MLPLAALTHKQKVGQVFIGVVHGERVDSNVNEFLYETKLGNILYFNWANGLESPDQVAALSQELRECIEENTGFTPLIGVDQEGGRVVRLKWLATPSAREIAAEQSIYATGKKIGAGLREVGVNLNFAPVVDVDSNPDNPVIGHRSFGQDPETVIASAEEMIEALHEEGILATLKHFPGHGDTDKDSHKALPVVRKSLEKIEAVELAPFAALKDKADAIMTAHVLFPALDEKNCATLSKPIITGLLRERWGYEGVVISDSLMMRGVAPHQETIEEAIDSVTEACLKAFDAGCDLMILARLQWAEEKTTPEQDLYVIKEVMHRFGERVGPERLDESVTRVLSLKQKIGNRSDPGLLHK